MRTTRPGRLRLMGWFIPLAYAGGALVVGMTFPRLEHRYLPGLISTMSAPAAMALCSTIASGMISLTGIVFSLTFVMVQFSAAAYSPRLVLWLARNPTMSHALGVFSATFLYALAMLAWIDRNEGGKVPLLSGWLVLGLLLASMGMFVALIERVGMLQMNRMLGFTGDEGRRAIEGFYRKPNSPQPVSEATDVRELEAIQTLTHTGPPKVIQTVQADALIELATVHDAVIELKAAVGDTLIDGATLLRIYQARQPLDEWELRRRIAIGDERTFEQDPKYALRLLVDIAIKALSPAINDPTTAVQALDQVEDLLLRLGRCRLEFGGWRNRQGRLCLLAPLPTWDDFLRLAFDEILSYGADSVQVMRRLMAATKNLRENLPAPRQSALRHWETRFRASISRNFEDAAGKREASMADRQGLGTGESQPESGVVDLPKQPD